MTWIKICGTTNLADALIALEAGADAVGFVFAESLRRITPEAAAEITRHLPENIEKIGVFTAETPERIKAIADQVGLTAVQLYQPVAIPGLDGREVIPVLHMSQIEDVERGDVSGIDESTLRILLDSGSAAKGGGTGQCFDWERARAFLRGRHFDTQYKVIVAGGLDPENVGEAIRVFRPYGVDVVSGVEREKGKKDPDKVRAFISAVRKAESTLKATDKVQA